MSAPIGPGAIVECVRFLGEHVGLHGDRAPGITVGSLYHVEGILPEEWFSDGEAGVMLFERPGHYPDGQRYCYGLSCFRPLGDRAEAPSSERLLDVPAPEFEGV